MFPNLEAEMARRHINKKTLSQRIDMPQTTLGHKINGKSKITLLECIEIRNAIDNKLSIDYLFEIEEAN